MKPVKSVFKMLVVIIFFATPYVSMFADRAAYMERGYFAVGGEFAIPILCYTLMFLLIEACESMGNKR